MEYSGKACSNILHIVAYQYRWFKECVAVLIALYMLYEKNVKVSCVGSDLQSGWALSTVNVICKSDPTHETVTFFLYN